MIVDRLGEDPGVLVFQRGAIEDRRRRQVPRLLERGQASPRARPSPAGSVLAMVVFDGQSRARIGLNLALIIAFITGRGEGRARKRGVALRARHERTALQSTLRTAGHSLQK